MAGEQPRPGGTLTFVVASEPPSFDAHRETTYAILHPGSPQYSTLLRYDPNDLTKIIPDVAASMPEFSPDKLTATVKLRTDVKFHDGTPMTGEDVLATYNKIVFPPQGVASARQGAYAAVESMSATKDTIVFKLKYPSASFVASLASPWNWIYSAAKLKQDIKWYEKNVGPGTGPFVFDKYTKGSDWTGKKNPDYFGKDKNGTQLPYLDGYKAIFIVDVTAQVNAIRGKTAQIEFRGFTPEQRDTLARALGTDLAIQEAPWICVNYITPNTKKAPFNDVRVRRALTIALDRWKMGEDLQKITSLRDIGGLMRPKGPFAMPDADLAKIAGFSRDAAAAKQQARDLLKAAGQEGLKFNLLNRNTPTPYEPLAIRLLDEWKQVGITVTNQPKQTTAYFADLDSGNFDVALDFNCDFLDEPDLQLAKFYSVSRVGTTLNRAGFNDTKLDGMIDAQSRETDPEKRKKLVWDIERYAMDEMAYMSPSPWWFRIIPYSNKVRGWKVGSNHYTNQDLVSVWLAP
ncbi:MAG TPA: ABC transporter substrate-binding protein [Candidatus Limnocylindria bacterium]|nr:ABC transporter substrate-binding protein [Candidatus Limnocylindria bacterium]